MPERSPAHAALGRALREARDERGLSQEALALDSDLHPTYLSGIERGHRNPSYASLLKLASTLGMPLSEIISRAERTPKG